MSDNALMAVFFVVCGTCFIVAVIIDTIWDGDE